MAVVYTLPTKFGPGFQNGILDGSAMDASFATETDATYSGLTAHSGGGTTSAVPLLYGINHVSVVAANNDSVILPASKLGATIAVINASTSTLAVYCQTGDAIKGGTAGGSTTQATLVVGLYYCPIVGQWWRVSGS